jgi:hypothetical protein
MHPTVESRGIGRERDCHTLRGCWTTSDEVPGRCASAMTVGSTLKYFATILSLVLACCAGADSARTSTPQTDRSLIRRYLQPALDAGTPVRFSYAATCSATDDIPPIPPIRLSAASGRSGIDIVRSTFKYDGNVMVTKGSGGIAKVTVGNVPTDLLQTRIALLRLKPIEQYYSGDLIGALVSTKEFEEAVKALGLLFVEPLRIQLEHVPQPGDPGPHVPATLHNVTVDQVLDLAAKTFREIVVFGICTSGPTPRHFSLLWPSQ